MRGLAGRVAVLVLVALITIVVAGCGSATSSGPAIAKVDAGTAVSMLNARSVIDVRTPAEYAAGHIAGARNIDVQGTDFTSAISTLDKGAAYLVYCHSGRRSAMAAEQMAAAGFTDIVDGGAMADLLAAGAPTQ
jgi:rhodanese-related sulfurtransferase